MKKYKVKAITKGGQDYSFSEYAPDIFAALRKASDNYLVGEVVSIEREKVK